MKITGVRTCFHVVVLVLASGLAVPAPAGAQHSPYAGHEDREIKGLSAEEADQLLTGQGMGLALPAELNGYPGPRHVLDLAAEIELDREQHDAVSKVFDAMFRQAVDLGSEIVAAERRLDALFARGEAMPETLRTALDELGALRAALRYAHLAAHLETRALLTEAQRRRYQELRGYGGEGPHKDHHEHGHPHGRP